MLLYHQDDKLAKYKKREKRYDDATETLLYFGKHPEIMKERIIRFQDPWVLATVEKTHIIGNEKDYRPEFLTKINSKEIIWCESIKEVPIKERRRAIIVSPNFFDKIFHGSDVPSKMKSKLAHEWSAEFLLTMKLSEKMIGLKG